MKGLNRAITVIAKIMEISSWVGCGLLTLSLIVLSIGRDSLLRFFTSAPADPVLTVGGLTIDKGTLTQAQLHSSYAVIFIAALIYCVLMAMIFRSIYLIYKTAAGETQSSAGSTPFQPVIIRMVRRIGILSLVLPVMDVVMGIAARLLIGHEAGKIAVNINMSGIFFGLVILSLSQFFSYGAQLQSEVDGLV